MENKTNKILELDDGKNYIIIRQILYKGITYFLACEVKENDELTKNVVLLQEEIENDKTFVENVSNPDTIKAIYKHLEKTEN
ncbi:MAG: hypothetical protein RR228_03135 [Bacilli bacterium]